MRGMRRTEILVFSAHAGIAGTQLVIFAILGNVYGSLVLAKYALPLAIATPVFLLLGLSLRVLYVTAEQEWSTRWYLRCTLVTAVFCTLVALGAQLFIETEISFVLALLTIKAFDLVQMSGLGVLQRNGRLPAGSMFLILNAVLSCLLAGAAALFSLGAPAVVWASAVGSVLSSVAIWMYVIFKLRISGGERGRIVLLVRRGIPLGLTTATINAAINLPTYILAATGNLTAMATYSVLSNLRTAVGMAYGTVAQVKLHDFSESVRNNDQAQFFSHLKSALTSVSIIGVLISAITIVLGPTIVPRVFGVEAEDWRLLLIYVSAGFMASGAIFVFDAALSAHQRYHQQVWTAAVAFAITGVLLLIIGDRINLTSASLSLAVALGSAAACKAVILLRVVLVRGKHGR